jgi:hypothetical protein
VADLLLDLLAVAYISFALIDLYVFLRIVAPARVKPPIDALTASAVVVGTILVGGLIGGLLGLNAVILNLSDQQIRLVPTPLSLILLRQLRRWRSGAALHLHARGTDRGTSLHQHRRATDAPDGPAEFHHGRATDGEKKP